MESNSQMDGDTLGAIFTGVSVAVGAFTLWWQLQRNNALVLSQHYSEIDSAYTALLAHGIERPKLRSPAKLLSDDEAINGSYIPVPPDHEDAAAYETYAHMVWCFVETLRDRCAELKDSKAKEEFRLTWATAIDIEDDLHRGWFLRSELGDHRLRRFRPEFTEFVRGKRWKSGDWEYK